MAFTFFGFASILRDDTIYPSSLPDDTPNMHFLGLHHLELTQIVEGLFEVVKQIPTLF
jgi:hypothetical protein